MIRPRVLFSSLLVPAAALLAPSISPAQAAGADAAIGTIRDSFAEVAAWVVKAADQVPEDRLSYRPAETVRTLGQLLGHIADGNNYYCGKAAGANPEWVETVALSGARKGRLLEELRRSIAGCAAAHAAANGSRVKELVANLGHVSLHYGNLVTYLRMLGMTPPSS